MFAFPHLLIANALSLKKGSEKIVPSIFKSSHKLSLYPQQSKSLWAGRYRPPPPSSSLCSYSIRPTSLKSHHLKSLTPIITVRLLSSRQDKPDNENQNSNSNSNRFSMLASLGVGATFLIGKTKYLFVALKLTKAMPLASMVLTSFAYSFFFGWPYAVGMVGLIFVHELGHLLVMKRYGVPFSPMVFVPFMGAFIAMKGLPKNSKEEAVIAFGGPVLGSVGALALATAAGTYDSQLLYALADFGYMINLFNLLPVGHMDGGRIASSIHPGIGVAGLGLGGYLVYAGAIHNPLMYLILLSGAYSTTSRIFGWDEETNSNPAYYTISGSDQAKITAAYIALIGALLAAMVENNKKKRTPRQLEREKKGQAGAFDWSYKDDEEAFGKERRAGDGEVEDGVYDDFSDLFSKMGEKVGLGEEKKD